MDKIREIFEETGKLLDQEIGIKLPDYKRNYKITAGENFDDCPYLVLDIPRINPQNFDFVFRIFFRWGQHFSLQCIINNEKFDTEKLLSHLIEVKSDLYILGGNDIWENRIEHANYKLIQHLNQAEFQSHQENYSWFKFCIIHSIKKPESLRDSASGFYFSMIKYLELSAK